MITMVTMIVTGFPQSHRREIPVLFRYFFCAKLHIFQYCSSALINITLVKVSIQREKKQE